MQKHLSEPCHNARLLFLMRLQHYFAHTKQKKHQSLEMQKHWHRYLFWLPAPLTAAASLIELKSLTVDGVLMKLIQMYMY